MIAAGAPGFYGKVATRGDFVGRRLPRTFLDPWDQWLQASLAHQERRYSDALATWRRLQSVVPADSSDARIVEANIAEAARLARS